jgi:hypothetical protein
MAIGSDYPRPTGVTVISGVNLILSALLSLGAYLQLRHPHHADGVYGPFVYVDVAVAVGLLVVTAGLFLGMRPFRRTAQVFFYALALYEALLGLLVLTRELSAASAYGLVLAVILVFYLIGARGYLNAPAAREFFGEPESPAD